MLVGKLAAAGCICGRCLQNEALVRLLFWSWWLERRDDSLILVKGWFFGTKERSGQNGEV